MLMWVGGWVVLVEGGGGFGGTFVWGLERERVDVKLLC